jgi:hypothetical protein
MRIVASSCALLGACDGHDAGEHDDQAAAQDGGDEPAEAHDGASDERESNDAGSDHDMDASSGADGGTRDAMIGASDASARDDRLQPLEVGRRWTYRRVAIDGGADAACEGSLESSVTKLVMRDAAVGYEYLPTCFGATKVQMFLSGDDIWAYVGSALAPVQYAASPVEAGVSWDGGSIQYVWEAQDTVTVPAGTFDRCIRRTGAVDKSGYLVLCRGVGLVLNENRMDGTRTELVSTNF